jgi:outer membrane protein TolC
VAPGIDVTRARTQVAAARGQMVVAQNQLERARMDLSRALGLDPATRFALADTLSAGLGASPAPVDSQSALALALERRPELRAERLRLSRARSERAAIAAERLPHLEASADLGLSGQDWPGSTTTRQVAIAASLPLLDGLRREGRLTEQRALISEAEVRERDLEQQIAAEVEGALLDLASGRELQTVSAERLALAGEELAQARERFTSGVAGNIEVINAQSSLVRARDAEIDARFAIGAARVNLARATGVCRSIH